MARVTIEDCIEKVGSHFRVVQIASHRAHQLELGAKPMVDKEGDKPVVIALREIAEGKIDERVLGKPLAEKESWEQEQGLLTQADNVEEVIADMENYSDINAIEDEDATLKQEADSEDEESKTDKV